MTDVGVLRGIRAPVDRWRDGPGKLGVLDELVLRSNLLGSDRALANQGGGNTSAKGAVADHTNKERRVLWVKGSGTDLASITEAGFAALRLDEILLLREREAMDDAAMVDYLLRCTLAPSQPRPSIETLLHAFIPAAHVDHTHPDAVIALTSSARGRELAAEAFGEEAVWLDYQRPGFDMSRRIADLLDANPDARAVLLQKHGLVTWGETSEESYRRPIDFVSRAADALDTAGSGRFGLGGAKVADAGEEDAQTLLVAALPALRGALLADANGVILEVDRSPEAVAFASSVEAPRVSQVGAPCPDHLINTKHRPLAVEFDPATEGAAALADALRDGVAAYAGWYRGYYERNVTEESRPFPIDPAGPRVVLIPGVGIVTSGGRGRGGGDRRVRLAHGGGGVRHRVLAAGAVQAGAGAAEGRARGARRADHRRGERNRARDGASAREARGACRRRRSERGGGAAGRRRARRRQRAAACGRGRRRRH
jgi:rhamnose utilization protein RhaD (predicted bifunctional aldolase and dehydrogenase)